MLYASSGHSKQANQVSCLLSPTSLPHKLVALHCHCTPIITRNIISSTPNAYAYRKIYVALLYSHSNNKASRQATTESIEHRLLLLSRKLVFTSIFQQLFAPYFYFSYSSFLLFYFCNFFFSLHSKQKQKAHIALKKKLVSTCHLPPNRFYYYLVSFSFPFCAQFLVFPNAT